MKLIDMEALKYFYGKLEQIFTGVTVTIDPQTFTEEQKAQARANIGAGSADFTGDYNDLINKPQVAGQSSINAGKTIKSWSETDGKVSITTQDISIDKSQISDFAHTHTSSDITDLDDMGFATEQYVTNAIDALPSPMVFKGSLGTDGTITSLPVAVKANTGFTYKVITDGTYSGQVAKSGDMFISDGSAWIYIPSADEPSGTVTSVGVSVPTGLSVDNTPITSSGTISISMESGYSIPTETKQGQWDDAYTHSQATHARTDATAVTASDTNGNIKIDGVDTTVYSHPTATAKTSGMYKITVDGTGHVSNAASASASDLSYSNTTSGLTSTDVQNAIDELVSKQNDYYKKTETYSKDEVDEIAEEKISTPQTAVVGQVLAVKAVDDDGKPTEWECKESSGGSSIIPDEPAYPGDQLYVKEVDDDGKPTKWAYIKPSSVEVYDTESRTEYKSYTGTLNGYNFLDSDGEVEHTIYRSDSSTILFDDVSHALNINDSLLITSDYDDDYAVIKRVDNEKITIKFFVGKELSLEKELLVYEKPPVTVYGFHIDSSKSDPSEAVTYLSDAVGLTPAHMDYSTGVFNYGSWENAFFMPKPCMLKYDGTVDYYLDPNDYKKKADGTASDVANTSYGGNAMIEWGQNGKKIWYKIVPDTNDDSSASIYIANEQADTDYHAWSFIGVDGNLKDHFYTPIYNGSLISNKLRSISGQVVIQNNTAEQEISYAQANGSGWNTEVWCDIELINFLLVLMGKSLDTQTVFGVGNMSGYSSSASNYGMLNTGTMNAKGMFWGKNASSSSDNSGVKVFGMENWWGNQYRRFAGLINDCGIAKAKMCYGTSDGSTTAAYNTTGSGYKTINTLPSSSGYITKITFSNGTHSVKTANGSATTYYCDYLYINNSQVNYASRGGGCGNGLRCGAFCAYLNGAASYSGWGVGASPSYKSL